MGSGVAWPHFWYGRCTENVGGWRLLSGGLGLDFRPRAGNWRGRHRFQAGASPLVRIRLSRLGRPHHPFYRINAIDKEVKRDGKVLENLGWYDPKAKDPAKQLMLKEDRIKHWLSVGAMPSDTMMDMLAKRSLVDAEAWAAHRARRVVAKKKAAEHAAAIAAAAPVKGAKGEKKE